MKYEYREEIDQIQFHIVNGVRNVAEVKKFANLCGYSVSDFGEYLQLNGDGGTSNLYIDDHLVYSPMFTTCKTVNHSDFMENFKLIPEIIMIAEKK